MQDTATQEASTVDSSAGHVPVLSKDIWARAFGLSMAQLLLGLLALTLVRQPVGLHVFHRASFLACRFCDARLAEVHDASTKAGSKEVFFVLAG